MRKPQPEAVDPSAPAQPEQGDSEAGAPVADESADVSEVEVKEKTAPEPSKDAGVDQKKAPPSLRLRENLRRRPLKRANPQSLMPKKNQLKQMPLAQRRLSRNKALQALTLRRANELRLDGFQRSSSADSVSLTSCSV